MKKKALYVATFGCQMNEYDSLKMVQMLSPSYEVVDAPEKADLILVNTCSIREKAENKVYSLVGRFKALKARKPRLKIGIAGCVAQQEGENMVRKAPYVDLVFGPHQLWRLPELVARLESGESGIVEVRLEERPDIPLVIGELPGGRPVRAFVTIMQGCDNFCTYCVVPHVRGRETSRPPGDIIEEVRSLVDQGVKDVTLLGQNVNSYGRKEKGGPGFAELLEMVASVPGLRRLRFTTSHPKDLDDAVMSCFAGIEQLCEHLHLPVQSGSNEILRRMNRRYTREAYLDKIERLRALVPDISITTDIIVGFPGETEKDYEATLSLLAEVGFDQIFAFKYSPRPFTKAAEMEETVPEEEKLRRLNHLLEFQNRLGLERLRRFEGRDMEILVEGHGKGGAPNLMGRTRHNVVVNFKGPEELIGEFTTVSILEAREHSLKASSIAPPSVRDGCTRETHIA